MNSESMMFDLSDEQLEQVVGGTHHKPKHAQSGKTTSSHPSTIINKTFIVVIGSDHTALATGGIDTASAPATIGGTSTGSNGQLWDGSTNVASASTNAGGVLVL